MKYNINKQFLNKLHKGVQNWHRDKYISQDEGWDYNRLEKSMDKYDDLLSYFETEHNVCKIGSGDDRIIFTSGNIVTGPSNTVIKVSRGDGTNQNETEVNVSKSLEEQLNSDVTEYIAPIIDYDKSYRWVIQRRVDQVTPSSSTKVVQNKFNDIGWVCSDIKPDNVGLLDSEPVLIDFGFGMRKK